MGLITPNDFHSVSELYTSQLRYLLSSENQIVKGLPGMIEHADDAGLEQAFQAHMQESEVHVTPLQQFLAEVSDKKDAILAAFAGQRSIQGTAIASSTPRITCLHSRWRDTSSLPRP